MKRAASRLEDTARRQLDHIRTTLQLSGPELGAIFNVSHQAVEQWHDDRIPPDKLAAIDRTDEILEELRKRFKAQRLPAVVRAPLPILDNRTILQTFQDDGPSAIYEFFRRWSSYVPDVEPVRKSIT